MVTAFGPTQQERETLLEGARRIAPQICDAADEIEAARQLPDHVVELLREAGAFRMIQPMFQHNQVRNNASHNRPLLRIVRLKCLIKRVKEMVIGPAAIHAKHFPGNKRRLVARQK